MFIIKFFIISMSLVFFSCANESNSVIVIDQEKSLQNQSSQRASQIIWTAGNVSSIDNTLSNNQTLEDNWAATTELSAEFSEKSEVIFIARLELDEPIYPQLQGFGSLNTSILPPPLLSMLDTFLKSLQTENIAENVFPHDKFYLKTLIEYDFELLPQVKTWVLGEPFLIDTSDRLVFEIPIRFVFDTGFCDGFIYSANYDDAFKIEQFSIGELQK